MKYLIIISLFFSLTCKGQDTATSEYFIVPQGWLLKWANFKHEYLGSMRQFLAVQDNLGRWVTSSNAFKEFPDQLKEIPPAFQFVRLRLSDFPKGGTPSKTNQ